MLTPVKEYEQRLKICSKCPNYTKMLGIGRCKLCGCVMAVKAKIAAMKCPANKWDSEVKKEK
jgi:hypothetical protein